MSLTSHTRSADVDRALVATTSLRQELLEHIDLFHWSLPVDDRDVLALRDYTLGVVNAIGSDLEQAWIAGSLYAQCRSSLSGRYNDNQRATGNPFTHGEIRDRINELSAESRIHRLSTIVSLAAALDCLAGSVCAILGIGVNVIKMDLGLLFKRPTFTPHPDLLRKLSTNSDWRATQEETLTTLGQAIQGAGPAGWAEWLLSERNTLVHRELPTDVIQMDHQHGRTIWRSVFLQSPHFSNIQSLQENPDVLTELVLTEDSTQTLNGLITSTADVVEQGAALLSNAWATRHRTRPTIPWELQWKPAGTKSEFQGYAPGTVDFSNAAAVMMGPEQAKRLREARLIKGS